MSWEAWGDDEELPELPDGWWDEDSVEQVQSAIKNLCAESMYEGGEMKNGVSVRFLARLTLLQRAANLLTADNPLVLEAEAMMTPPEDANHDKT